MESRRYFESLVVPIDGFIRFPELLLLVHYRVACTCVFDRQISGDKSTDLSLLCSVFRAPCLVVVCDFYCGSLLGIVWSAFQAVVNVSLSSQCSHLLDQLLLVS